MRIALAAIALAAALPAAAQAPMAPPGAPDPSRVVAGSYKADPAHTQVAWSVNHMGISTLYGAFGMIEGTLDLDPKAPSAAKLALTIPMSGLTVTAPAFAHHLSTPDFFDTAKYASATFVSTSVAVKGASARVTGDLTLHGVTRPVVLDAKFFGAGTSPMSKKLDIGFSATGMIKRSDFGLGNYAPMVSDDVDLTITAAFEKQ